MKRRASRIFPLTLRLLRAGFSVSLQMQPPGVHVGHPQRGNAVLQPVLRAGMTDAEIDAAIAKHLDFAIAQFDVPISESLPSDP